MSPTGVQWGAGLSPDDDSINDGAWMLVWTDTDTGWGVAYRQGDEWYWSNGDWIEGTVERCWHLPPIPEECRS